MSEDICDHLSGVDSVRAPTASECVACVRIGSGWVHLRTCQSCGLTHCCDSSPNRHATKHARESRHPVVASAEAGERWLWCYFDELMAEY